MLSALDDGVLFVLPLYGIHRFVKHPWSPLYIFMAVSPQGNPISPIAWCRAQNDR